MLALVQNPIQYHQPKRNLKSGGVLAVSPQIHHIETWIRASDAREQQRQISAYQAVPPAHYPSYFGGNGLPLTIPGIQVTPGQTERGAIRSVYTQGNTANSDVVYHDPRAGHSRRLKMLRMATYVPAAKEKQVPPPMPPPSLTPGNGGLGGGDASSAKAAAESAWPTRGPTSPPVPPRPVIKKGQAPKRGQGPTKAHPPSIVAGSNRGGTAGSSSS
ncbi:hypothetical protein QBC35DRAFT_548494 [Podospora australis]|uniref:Uncharacterized protein n=1 Tax=Podospora australis TaxID=1536484 RepID=A0AAN6WI64_9PEZI|nr:hypothetical protein QBC35DRAFT_548494 [Podospora australis]